MSVGPLIADILCVFLLSVYLLHKYGDWRKQHLLVTLTTFVSWYFCLVIVFMIPLDVSSVSYILKNYIYILYLMCDFVCIIEI